MVFFYFIKIMEHQGFCSDGAIYLHSLLESELSDSFVWYANLIFGKAKEQGRVNLDAPPQKQKRHPNGCRFCGGASLTKVELLL